MRSNGNPCVLGTTIVRILLGLTAVPTASLQEMRPPGSGLDPCELRP